MGHSIIVTAFIIIIVGGIGSLEGAVIAAVLYAFVHTFVTTFFDGVIANIVGLALMLAVLVVRPTGLFGRQGTCLNRRSPCRDPGRAARPGGSSGAFGLRCCSPR